MKVIRKQLIEAAKTCTDYKSKYNISALNEKTNFFLVCLFYCFFLRLQIYEAIAAIFWQSASYFSKFTVKSFAFSENFISFLHLTCREFYKAFWIFSVCAPILVGAYYLINLI